MIRTIVTATLATILTAPSVFAQDESTFLSGTRGKSRGELSRFLFVRGLWLVVLEYTLVTWAWTFAWPPPLFFHQVIAVIGVSLMVLAGALWLPRSAVAVFGLLLIGGHNGLDGIGADDVGAFGLPWTFLHLGQSFVPLESGGGILVIYPLVPWVGVLLLGWALGPLFLLPAVLRRRVLLGLGTATVLLFVALRGLDVYGDPTSLADQVAGWRASHGGAEPTLSIRLMGFLNLQKYPPSLLYLAMTLGPALLGLAWLEREPGAVGSRLVTLGRVPLFYYLAHLGLLHLGACATTWFLQDEFASGMTVMLQGRAGAAAHGLGAVYAGWLVGTVLLWFPCAAFARLKRRHPGSKLLSFL